MYVDRDGEVRVRSWGRDESTDSAALEPPAVTGHDELYTPEVAERLREGVLETVVLFRHGNGEPTVPYTATTAVAPSSEQLPNIGAEGPARGSRAPRAGPQDAAADGPPVEPVPPGVAEFLAKFPGVDPVARGIVAEVVPILTATGLGLKVSDKYLSVSDQFNRVVFSAYLDENSNQITLLANLNAETAEAEAAVRVDAGLRVAGLLAGWNEHENRDGVHGALMNRIQSRLPSGYDRITVEAKVSGAEAKRRLAMMIQVNSQREWTYYDEVTGPQQPPERGPVGPPRLQVPVPAVTGEPGYVLGEFFARPKRDEEGRLLTETNGLLPENVRPVPLVWSIDSAARSLARRLAENLVAQGGRPEVSTMVTDEGKGTLHIVDSQGAKLLTVAMHPGSSSIEFRLELSGVDPARMDMARRVIRLMDAWARYGEHEESRQALLGELDTLQETDFGTATVTVEVRGPEAIDATNTMGNRRLELGIQVDGGTTRKLRYGERAAKMTELDSSSSRRGSSRGSVTVHSDLLGLFNATTDEPQFVRPEELVAKARDGDANAVISLLEQFQARARADEVPAEVVATWLVGGEVDAELAQQLRRVAEQLGFDRSRVVAARRTVWLDRQTHFDQDTRDWLRELFSALPNDASWQLDVLGVVSVAIGNELVFEVDPHDGRAKIMLKLADADQVRLRAVVRLIEMVGGWRDFGDRDVAVAAMLGKLEELTAPEYGELDVDIELTGEVGDRSMTLTFTPAVHRPDKTEFTYTERSGAISVQVNSAPITPVSLGATQNVVTEVGDQDLIAELFGSPRGDTRSLETVTPVDPREVAAIRSRVELRAAARDIAPDVVVRWLAGGGVDLEAAAQLQAAAEEFGYDRVPQLPLWQAVAVDAGVPVQTVLCVQKGIAVQPEIAAAVTEAAEQHGLSLPTAVVVDPEAAKAPYPYATPQEVAAAAGVSVATVQEVVSRQRPVRDLSHRRALTAMLQLGYRERSADPGGVGNGDRVARVAAAAVVSAATVRLFLDGHIGLETPNGGKVFEAIQETANWAPASLDGLAAMIGAGRMFTGLARSSTGDSVSAPAVDHGDGAVEVPAPELTAAEVREGLQEIQRLLGKSKTSVAQQVATAAKVQVEQVANVLAGRLVTTVEEADAAQPEQRIRAVADELGHHRIPGPGTQEAAAWLAGCTTKSVADVRHGQRVSANMEQRVRLAARIVGYPLPDPGQAPDKSPTEPPRKPPGPLGLTFGMTVLATTLLFENRAGGGRRGRRPGPIPAGVGDGSAHTERPVVPARPTLPADPQAVLDQVAGVRIEDMSDAQADQVNRARLALALAQLQQAEPTPENLAVSAELDAWHNRLTVAQRWAAQLTARPPMSGRPPVRLIRFALPGEAGSTILVVGDGMARHWIDMHDAAGPAADSVHRNKARFSPVDPDLARMMTMAAHRLNQGLGGLSVLRFGPAETLADDVAKFVAGHADPVFRPDVLLSARRGAIRQVEDAVRDPRLRNRRVRPVLDNREAADSPWPGAPGQVVAAAMAWIGRPGPVDAAAWQALPPFAHDVLLDPANAKDVHDAATAAGIELPQLPLWTVVGDAAGAPADVVAAAVAGRPVHPQMLGPVLVAAAEFGLELPAVVESETAPEAGPDHITVADVALAAGIDDLELVRRVLTGNELPANQREWLILAAELQLRHKVLPGLLRGLHVGVDELARAAGVLPELATEVLRGEISPLSQQGRPVLDAITDIITRRRLADRAGQAKPAAAGTDAFVGRDGSELPVVGDGTAGVESSQPDPNFEVVFSRRQPRRIRSPPGPGCPWRLSATCSPAARSLKRPSSRLCRRPLTSNTRCRCRGSGPRRLRPRWPRWQASTTSRSARRIGATPSSSRKSRRGSTRRPGCSASSCHSCRCGPRSPPRPMCRSTWCSLRSKVGRWHQNCCRRPGPLPSSSACRCRKPC